MSKRRYITENDIALMMLALKLKLGSHQEAAKAMSISPKCFLDVIQGKKEVTATMAKYFSYEPVYVFQRVQMDKSINE